MLSLVVVNGLRPPGEEGVIGTVKLGPLLVSHQIFPLYPEGSGETKCFESRN